MIDFSIYMHVSFYFATNGLIMKYNYVMIFYKVVSKLKEEAAFILKCVL